MHREGRGGMKDLFNGGFWTAIGEFWSLYPDITLYYGWIVGGDYFGKME